MATEEERAVLAVLSKLSTPHDSNDPSARLDELLRRLGVWEVAHRLRTLSAEHDADVKLFLKYLAQKYPAAADRIQTLLTATKGEDKELLTREFGSD